MINSVELRNQPSTQTPVVNVPGLVIERGLDFGLTLKRAFDILLSAVSLIRLLPLLLLAMLAIILDSAGHQFLHSSESGKTEKFSRYGNCEQCSRGQTDSITKLVRVTQD